MTYHGNKHMEKGRTKYFREYAREKALEIKLRTMAKEEYIISKIKKENATKDIEFRDTNIMDFIKQINRYAKTEI